MGTSDRTLIRGGVVLSLDPAVGDFEEADVLIEGKTIVAVERGIVADAKVIDASRMIVVPGFIDTHHHHEVHEHVVVCGHTHVHFGIDEAGHRIVSPGSVGAPNIRATAWWAQLGPDIALRTTDYDVDATAAAVRARGLAGFADMLEHPRTNGELLALLDGTAT